MSSCRLRRMSFQRYVLCLVLVAFAVSDRGDFKGPVESDVVDYSADGYADECEYRL